MNERIRQLAEQAGLNVKTNISGVPLVFGTFEGYKTSHISVEELEMFAALVAAAEREACAKAVEIFDKTFQTGGGIAGSIRARGKK